MDTWADKGPLGAVSTGQVSKAGIRVGAGGAESPRAEDLGLRKRFMGACPPGGPRHRGGQTERQRCRERPRGRTQGGEGNRSGRPETDRCRRIREGSGERPSMRQSAVEIAGRDRGGRMHAGPRGGRSPSSSRPRPSRCWAPLLSRQVEARGSHVPEPWGGAGG